MDATRDYHVKKNKQDWLSNRVPAYKVQSPEFKPQYHQKIIIISQNHINIACFLSYA
jgi:hypothetical protein